LTRLCPYTLGVKLALIFPPACDPTAPYPAVAALAGFLRPQGIEVLPIDANLDGFLALLQREPLALLCDRIERRIARLQRRRALDHQAQLVLLDPVARARRSGSSAGRDWRGAGRPAHQ